MARVSFADVKRVGIALAWILLYAAIGLGITIGIAELVPGWGGQTWFVFRNGAYEVIGFLVATIVVGRLLNKYSWDRMGWHTKPGGLVPWLLRGVGLGALMAMLAIGLAFVIDRATVRFTGDWSAWPRVVLPLALGLVLAALGEELMFRGYPLRRLAEAIGALPAMLILAVLFGIAHARNPNATFFSTVNVALAAIWLSFAFFSAGGMALAWGLHFGWNAGLAILFDAPVSGFAFHVPVVEYTPGRHAWVDGGAFGPEGGIVATVALLAGTFYLLSRPSAFSLQPSVEPEKVAAA
jgi:membrane protease YdiL (CAAX protease family)